MDVLVKKKGLSFQTDKIPSVRTENPKMNDSRRQIYVDLQR